jgi:hypothetical protein
MEVGGKKRIEYGGDGISSSSSTVVVVVVMIVAVV